MKKKKKGENTNSSTIAILSSSWCEYYKEDFCKWDDELFCFYYLI